MKKEKFVHIKTTVEERAKWQELARSYGLSLSKLIRKLLDNSPLPIVYQIQQSENELTKEIRKIGININQIAKCLNEGRDQRIYLHILNEISENLKVIKENVLQGD